MIFFCAYISFITILYLFMLVLEQNFQEMILKKMYFQNVYRQTTNEIII